MNSIDGRVVTTQGTFQDGTERENAGELLKTLANSSPVGIYVAQDGKFCYVNPSFQSLTGYGEDELLGRNSLELVIVEDREIVRENAAKMLEGKLSCPYQFRVAYKGGDIRWIMESVSSIQYRGRQAILGSYMDVTKYRQVEDMLELQKVYFQQLFDNSPDAIVMLDTEDRIVNVNKGFEVLFGYPAEGIKGLLINELIIPEDHAEEASALSRAALSGEAVRAETVRRRKNGSLVDVSAVGYPIRFEGRVIGVYVIYSDITERKQAELRIADSEGRYRLVAENVMDVIWKVNIDSPTRLNYISPSVTHLLGYSVEEAMNKTMEEVFTPASFKTAMKALAEEMAVVKKEHADQHKSRTLELELQRKDGSLVEVEVNYVFIRDLDGRPVEILAVARDITERKCAEQQLRQSERKYSTLVEKGNDGIIIIQEGLIKFANPKLVEITGFSLEEAIDKSFVDFVSPEYREFVVDSYTKRMSGESVPDTYEIEILSKDGKSIPVEINASAIEYEGGCADMAIVHDITHHKRMEEELRKSEAKYRTLIERLQEGVYQSDLLGNYITLNQAGARIFGFDSPEEVIGKYKTTDLYYDLSERAKIIKDMKSSGSSMREVRAKRRDGTIIWMLANNNARLDGNGDIIGYEGVFTDITERKQAEEETKQAKERLQLQIERMPAGLIVSDTQFRIQTWNPAAEKIFGFTAEEALGKHPYDIIVPREAQPYVDTVWRRLLTGEMTAHSVNENITKDGRTIVCDWTNTPLRNDDSVVVGVLSIVQDITEHKRAEHEIRVFSNAVAGAIDAIAITDMKGIITYANPAMEEIFGYKKGQMLGKSAISLNLNPEMANEIMSIMAKTGSWKGEIESIKKNKETFPALLSLSTVKDEKGNPIAMMGALRDITERKREEEELEKYREHLEELVSDRTKELDDARQAALGMMRDADIQRQRAEETAKQLEIASRAKSEFLANMSHELRTPLNAVIGFAQVLQEQYFGQLNEKQADYVNDILDSGRHLLSLINDILDLSKIEAGKVELELSMVNIKELLEGSLLMVREKTKKQGISLSLQATTDLNDLEISADERKVRQIMFNLLSNAVKFTPDGGTIMVEGRKEAEKVIISVSDTGIGIEPKHQKQIFERFSQIRGGSTDKTPGTGLGLPLAKELTEMHGGKLWVESEGLGNGSRFSFTLPLQRKDGKKKLNRKTQMG